MPGRHSSAVCGESADDGRSDLCSHSDEEFGDSAVHLFPVLKFLSCRLIICSIDGDFSFRLLGTKSFIYV